MSRPANDLTVIELPLAEIRTDGGTQPRAGLHPQAVEDYAAVLAEGGQLPPGDAFFDGEHYWLAGGFHRLAAHRKAGRGAMPVRVHRGGPREAFLFGVSDNARHGVRYSNADKQAIVRRMLADPEWSRWSNREIARRAGVSHGMVNELRASLDALSSEATGPAESAPSLDSASSDQRPRAYTTRHGTESTMRTAGIGGSSRGGGPSVPPSRPSLDSASSEPAFPPAPAPVDDVGAPLPDNPLVRDAFARRHAMAAVAQQVTTIKSVLAGFMRSADPLATFIDPQDAAERADSLRMLVTAAMPYAACPMCGGRGCKLCRRQGWLTRQLYEQCVPAELKRQQAGGEQGGRRETGEVA